MSKARVLYEKIMVDFKRFGITSLALSAFLYLGVVLPLEDKTIIKTDILMGGTVFITFTFCLFSFQSNRYRKILLDSDEGEEYLMKNSTIMCYFFCCKRKIIKMIWIKKRMRKK